MNKEAIIATINLLRNLEVRNTIYTPLGVLYPREFEFMQRRKVFEETHIDGVYKFSSYESFIQSLELAKQLHSMYFGSRDIYRTNIPSMRDYIVSHLASRRVYSKRQYVDMRKIVELRTEYSELESLRFPQDPVDGVSITREEIKRAVQFMNYQENMKKQHEEYFKKKSVLGKHLVYP